MLPDKLKFALNFIHLVNISNLIYFHKKLYKNANIANFVCITGKLDYSGFLFLRLSTSPWYYVKFYPQYPGISDVLLFFT